MLAEFGDVFHHLRRTRNPVSINRDQHHYCRCHQTVVSLDLSEGFSFILLAGVLGKLLQGGGPLGPLLHFDQTGQQTDQQEEHQQAQQGDDCHVQSLQLVGCRKWKMEEDGRWKPNQ